MEKTTIETSMAPEVMLTQVDGNLDVRGWNRPQVVITAPQDSLEVEEGQDSLHLTCSGDCDIRLPDGAILQVENVSGNAAFKNISDQLMVGEVHGNLDLRNTGGAQIESVHGEFYAKILTGDLSVAQVYGNAVVRGVQGACVLEDVQGNVDLRDIEYNAQVSAEGNAHMRLSILLGEAYRVKATGNVNCRIPAEADLQISLTSETEAITLRLPDGRQSINEKTHELTFGEAGAALEIVAGGAISLAADGGRDLNWEETGNLEEMLLLNQQIAQQVESQIREQMATITEQINEQMAGFTERIGQAGLSPEETERIMEQARLVSEVEATRAQEKLRRAQEKLERKLQAAQRKRDLHEQRKRHYQASRSKVSWGVSGGESAHKEPVSEEERLAILRMLEEKKISLEEAEQLLSALEGS